MPLKSKRQARYFFANKEKLEAQGVNFKEWISSTNFKKLPEKVASVATVLAPMTGMAENVDLAFKDPKRTKRKQLSDRLVDIVDAQDALEDQNTGTYGHAAGTGALVGGLIMGSKGALMAGGNPAAALGFTAVGAGVGAGVSVLGHLIRNRLQAPKIRNAKRTMKDSFGFDENILADPEIRDEVEKYRSAKYGPLFGAEGGATLGSMGGAILKAHQATSDGPQASILGMDLPLSQAKAEAAGSGGLVGGLAGLAIGGAIGFGYRAYRRRALRVLLKKKLSKEASLTLDISKGDILLGGKFKNVPTVVDQIGTDELGQPTINGKKLLSFRIKKTMPTKTAEVLAKLSSVWLKDNKGRVTDLQGGRPKSSSNRRMMVGQDVEHYAAGMPEPRYPFTPVTEPVERYAAGKKVAEVLTGGRADGKPTTKYPAREVLLGAHEETEHTSNPKAAVEIAKDHLEEDSHYYSKMKLAGMLNGLSSWVNLAARPVAKAVNKAELNPTVLDAANSSSHPSQTGIFTPSTQKGTIPSVYKGGKDTPPGATDIRNQVQPASEMADGLMVGHNPAPPVVPSVMSKIKDWATGQVGKYKSLLTGAAVGAGAVGAARSTPTASTTETALPSTPTKVPMDWAGPVFNPQGSTPSNDWAGPTNTDSRKLAFVKEAGMTLRERSEVICTNGKGVLAIKKPGYLLLPGGGLNDGESAEAAVVREAIEEADQVLDDLQSADSVRVAYIGEGPSKGFDGELTHFYTATDGGKIGTEHPDREEFKWIPFDEALTFLTEMLVDDSAAWAFDNNLARIKLIEAGTPGADKKSDKLQSAEIVRADSIKTADQASFLPRAEFVLFNKDGKLVVQKGKNRRFNLPSMGVGAPAPYERPIQFLPPEGVPEPGAHGYDIGLRVGDTDTVPEGYEAMDPSAALKDMYASMGMAANRPYQALDRARARAIVRYLKKKQKANVQASPV